MEKTQETKLMIIENFINHLTTDELKRKQMKLLATSYVEDDHVDEIFQSGFVVETNN